MADHHPTPVEVNPKELERSAHMWHAFTKIGKWSIIATSCILFIMALVFIR